MSPSDSRPRVLVVARMSPRLNSRTRTLLRALSVRFRVTVLSEIPKDVATPLRNLDHAQLIEMSLPLPNHPVWHLAGLLRVLVFNLYAAWLVIRDRYSIVVCSDSLYILAGLVARLLRRHFVYNSHEIMWALGNPPMLSSLLGGLERLAISASDFWLVPSEERAKIILHKHHLTKKYFVYQNYPIEGIESSDRETFRSKLQAAGVPIDKPIVMFQGSLTEDRGLKQIVQAATLGEFHLVIQGNGRLLEWLNSHQHEHMTLLPSCPNHEAVGWLSAADMSFIYYENNCLNSAYACSSKFYAAIFAGSLIICNRLPAFEVFSSAHGGVVFFDLLSPREISERITKVLSSPAEYNRLKQEMRVARESLQQVSQEQILSEAFDRFIS